eukprot:7249480-Ditylum_brightwellii.AAC.1
MFFTLVDWETLFGEWVLYSTVVIKEEIEAALFCQHIKHFSQAAGMPFTTMPTIEKFGEYAKKVEGTAF